MYLTDVRLEANEDHGTELRSFYVDTLGFEDVDPRREALAGVVVGESVLRLVPASKPCDPHYHFALLVPGDRFDGAYA